MDYGSLKNAEVSVMEDQTARETTNSSSVDSLRKDGGIISEPVVFSAKSHKKMSSKESPRTSLNSLNKFKSQIKKSSSRNGSPLNWIPRQKGDTYLKRKIQQLQEASGMNSTLDETLGTANPHYCRVLREKIASRQAGVKAMEARKAAMVEASWCRILKAARIPSKEAEAMLSVAEKNAVDAVAAATAKGVMMYDTVDCPQKQYQIETAFEVDKQVAAAVKSAFVRLAANCPSSLNKDEYSGLLRKISEKPESDENNQDLSGSVSEGKSDSGLEFALGSEEDSVNQMDEEIKFGMFGRRQSPEKDGKERLVDVMLGRLKCLKEEELASLATIVATCGLNAALAEMENQHQDTSSYANCNSRRMSSYGSRRSRNSSMGLGLLGKQQPDVELPSLDKCLIKHTTKLEREVQDARNAREKDSKEGQENTVKSNKSNVTEVASLESILVKHSSRLEKEKAELKRKIGQISELDQKEKGGKVKQKVDEIPSLDKFLVKHVSRLEREVQEAKSRRDDESYPASMKNVSTVESSEKENIDLNSNEEAGLDSIMVKHFSRLEREVQEAKSRRDDESCPASMKNVSTVESSEKENIDLNSNKEGGLDSILVKHTSKLEREKMVVAEQDQHHDQTKQPVSRRKAREREMQEAWGGMSLDNCVRPHMSRLEREKAAWIKAEEEKKQQCV